MDLIAQYRGEDSEDDALSSAPSKATVATRVREDRVGHVTKPQLQNETIAPTTSSPMLRKRRRSQDKAEHHQRAAWKGLDYVADEVGSSSEDDASSDANSSNADQQWIRSFPHVEGNWPSHIHIEVPINEPLCKRIDMLILGARKLVEVKRVACPLYREGACELVPVLENSGAGVQNLHLSLSRQFVLKYEQINPFVDRLKFALRRVASFRVSMSGCAMYVNDEKTRTFFSIPVKGNRPEFIGLIRKVDIALIQFQKERYYDPALPHISVASVLGDLISGLKISKQEQESYSQIPSLELDIACVVCNIGNKRFEMPLLSGESSKALAI